jgi:hypothetical protein
MTHKDRFRHHRSDRAASDIVVVKVRNLSPSGASLAEGLFANLLENSVWN